MEIKMIKKILLIAVLSLYSCEKPKNKVEEAIVCDSLLTDKIDVLLAKKEKVSLYPGILIMDRDSLYDVYKSDKVEFSTLAFCNKEYQQLYNRSYIYTNIDILKIKSIAVSFLISRQNKETKPENLQLVNKYNLYIDNFGLAKIIVFKFDNDYLSFIDNGKKMIAFLSSGIYTEYSKLKSEKNEFNFMGFVFHNRPDRNLIVFMRFNGCYFEPYHSEWIQLPEKEIFINGILYQ